MTTVFISYRRKDASAAAGLIRQAFAETFGDDHVQQDVRDLVPGDRWRSRIVEALSQATIVVVVIGNRWVDEFMVRSGTEDTDWLLVELREAVEAVQRDSRKTIFPIYVDGATESALDDLHAKCTRQMERSQANQRILGILHDIERVRSTIQEMHHKVLHTDQDPTEELRRLAHGLMEKHPHLSVARERQWQTRLEDGQYRGKVALGLLLLAVSALSVWARWGPAPRVDGAALAKLLSTTIWVAYDPREHAATTGTAPVTREGITRDLRHIRAAGFTGIATFGADKSLAQIPQIAKEQKLAVIMGIYDPTSRDECARAGAQKEYVDAYCVGNNRLGRDYQLSDVKRAIRWLKRRTHRPVTVTQLLDHYVSQPELSMVGDWVFPDVHLGVDFDDEPVAASPALLADRLCESVKRIEATVRGLDRPIMLRAVCCPHKGGRATEESQRAFLLRVLEVTQRQGLGFPVSGVMVHEAFDAQWKLGKEEYSKSDPFLGLIDSDGRARPAALAIMSVCPSRASSSDSANTK